MAYKVDMFEKNIIINTNVLKVCHEIKVKKVISLQLPPSHFEIDALNLSAIIIKIPCSNRWFLSFPQKIPLRGLHTIIKSKL